MRVNQIRLQQRLKTNDEVHNEGKNMTINEHVVACRMSVSIVIYWLVIYRTIMNLLPNFERGRKSNFLCFIRCSLALRSLDRQRSHECVVHSTSGILPILPIYHFFD